MVVERKIMSIRMYGNNNKGKVEARKLRSRRQRRIGNDRAGGVYTFRSNYNLSMTFWMFTCFALFDVFANELSLARAFTRCFSASIRLLRSLVARIRIKDGRETRGIVSFYEQQCATVACYHHILEWNFLNCFLPLPISRIARKLKMKHQHVHGVLHLHLNGIV